MSTIHCIYCVHVDTVDAPPIEDDFDCILHYYVRRFQLYCVSTGISISTYLRIYCTGTGVSTSVEAQCIGIRESDTTVLLKFHLLASETVVLYMLSLNKKIS